METNKYGRILSYKPNIYYNKKNNLYSLKENYNYGTGIEDYINTTPYNNVNKANNILASAEEIMNSLQEQFFETRYNGYTFAQYSDLVTSNKNNTVNGIYDEAFYDIDSDIVIEIFKDVYNEYENVIKFDKMYKNINYGNDEIEIQEVYDIDNKNIQKIISYSNSNIEKINYSALYYESKLNKIVELKLELSDLLLNSLASTPLPCEVERISSGKSTIQDGAKVLFDTINEKYSKAREKFLNAHLYTNFNKLYNYISNLLVEYYDLLNMKESLFDNAGNSFCSDIERLLQDKGEEIDFYILELYKLVANDSIVIDEYFDLLNKKDQIKKFYKYLNGEE